MELLLDIAFALKNNIDFSTTIQILNYIQKFSLRSKYNDVIFKNVLYYNNIGNKLLIYTRYTTPIYRYLFINHNYSLYNTYNLFIIEK